MTMQAIKRWSSQPHQKLPLTTALLAQACLLVPLAPVEFRECWEALVFGVWFLLQLGEMVPDKEPFDSQRHLNSSSLTVTTNQGAGLVLELQLIKTKTDQLGTGQVRAVTCVCPQVPYDVSGACGSGPSSTTFINQVAAQGGHYCSRQVTPHGAAVPMQEWADVAVTAGSQGDQVAGGSAGMQSSAIFGAFSVAQ